MSGPNGTHHAAEEEAARLEAALDRIARAASAARQRQAAAPPESGLHAPAPHATTAPDTMDMAARIDALIAEIRSVLGTQGI